MATTSNERISAGQSLADQRTNLPQNIEAEASVLAACMLSAEAADELVSRLTPEDFFRPAHRILFETIIDLTRRNIPLDPITIADTLKANGNLEAIGGSTYLIDLSDNTFSLTNWQRHGEIVKRMAILRGLVYAATQINALAYDAPDDLDQAVEEAEKTIFDVTEKRVTSDFEPINTLLLHTFDEIDKLAKQKGSIVGVPTGFKDIDDLFHGFRGGELIILAARPGVGKTALALNMAVNAAKAGTTVAFFSLEMRANELVQRILCSEARVQLSKIRGAGKLTQGDWSMIAEASGTLSNLNFFIDDSGELSVLEARAKARRELRHRPEGAKGFIVVDYLQLMRPVTTKRDQSRAVEVGEISRGLKVLAKELDMPVLALSQLNRSVDYRGTKYKRPMLSDLRESGSIEQDSDIVMFIDRCMDEMEAENESRPPLGMATLIVAKHRNGALRDIPLAFNAENTRFMDYVDDSRVGSFS